MTNNRSCKFLDSRILHAMDIRDIMSTLRMETYKKIEGRPSIVDVFHQKDRCGIYLLRFDGDEYYVGQSKNIPGRYVQHRGKHKDITHIMFKSIKNEWLDVEEADAIGRLESHVKLRNIRLMSAPELESDLDGIYPREEQDQWLNSVSTSPNYMIRTPEKSLRDRYTRRFHELSKDKFFFDSILPVMKKYVSLCIPEPFLTEISFWGCSCLPGGHSNPQDIEIYSRINIYWQEVFTVGKILKTKEPIFSWHLSKKELFSLSKQEIKSRFGHIASLVGADDHYKTGGQDQFNLEVFSTEDAMKLLDDKMIIDSMKLFNWRNMRKGASNNADSHCMDLADLLLHELHTDNSDEFGLRTGGY